MTQRPFPSITPPADDAGPAPERHEVVVVGAGPIGLELAVSLKAAGVDYIQLEAGQIGRTISWYPKQAHFFSSPDRIAIAGTPLVTPDQSKATREGYLAYLRGVVQQHALSIQTYEQVTNLIPPETPDGDFAIRTQRHGQGRAYAARHVVLAVGDMHHPARLGIPGEDLPHVSHYFDEPHRYFGQRLLIVGGKNSAVEAALRCTHAGAQVALSYRRDAFSQRSIKYWLLPEIKALIKHGKIKFHGSTVPTRITPSAITLAPTDPETGELLPGGASEQTAADFVLLLTGYTQDPTLWDLAGVEREGENGAPVHDKNTMMTNVPNLYVAGTAAAGTQRHFKLFIENTHPHVPRIVRAITGESPLADLINQAAFTYGLPES